MDENPQVVEPGSGQDEFGALLRQLRTDRGLSLTALSRLLHYSKGYLSKIENGGKPAGLDLARRCDAVLGSDGALLRLAESLATDGIPDLPGAAATSPADVGRDPLDLPCPYPGLAAFGPDQAPWYAGRDEAIAALLHRLTERAGHGPLALVAPSGAGKSSLLRAGLLPALARGALDLDGSRSWRVALCTPTAYPLDALRRALESADSVTPGSAAPRAAVPWTAVPGSALPGSPAFGSGAPGSGHSHTGAPGSAPSGSGAPSFASPDSTIPGPEAPGQETPGPDGLVLVVDQFEEAFTLCVDERERRDFIRKLCALASPPGSASHPEPAALGPADPEPTDSDRPARTEPPAAPGMLPAPAPPVLVVLGVRADFCGRCLEYPELVSVFTQGLLALGPMTGPELRESISRPAAAAGLVLEPGLIEVLLRDLGVPDQDLAEPAGPTPPALTWPDTARAGSTPHADPRGLDGPLLYKGHPDGGDPRHGAASPQVGPGWIGGPGVAGVLPLLSHALLATWQQREGRTLTVAGYLRTGGIHGAVAATAENVFARLTPAGRRTARSLLLRLVHVGENSEEARCPVDREQLLRRLATAGPGSVSRPGTGTANSGAVSSPVSHAVSQPLSFSSGSAALVLDAFVRARLLTVDSETVAITHEALLRAWPRLHGWIYADRAGLLIRQQLAEAGAEWERERRDPTVLYRGTKLAAAREWFQDPRHQADLTPQENAFLTASQHQEEERGRAHRRQVRRQRRLLITLAALLALAVAAGGIAYQQRAGAFTERRTALSRAMAAESTALAAGRPEASMLLAAQAFRTAPTTEARGALLSTQAQPFAGRLSGHTGPVNGVAFSPDAMELATASSDGTVKVWSVADRQVVTTLTGHGGPVRTVAFSPDGRTIASGSLDGTVRLWDLSGRQLPVTFFGHGGAVRSVAFCPDGRTVVSGGADGTVRLWDTGSHTLLATLTGHSDEVLAVAVAPDGRTLASAGADHTVRLWDTGGRALLATLTGHSDEVLGLAFSPDGRTLASAAADRTVRLWDTGSHTLTATLTGHSDDVNAVAYADDGATLVSASGDGTVRLWDLATRRVTATLCGHTDYVQGVAVSQDGTLLATAGFDQSAVLWDVGRAALTVHPYSEIWQAVFSPDGRTVAAADADHSIRIWDVAHHTLIGTLSGHDGSVFGIAFSPDGRLLASASADHTVRLWDVAEREQLAVLSGHQGSVFAVAFSPDGRLVASAGEDRTVRMWDVRGRRPAGVLTGHTDFVNDVAFSPDGRTLASGSDDLTVRLWNVAYQRLTGTFTGHTGSVRGVAFSPDGRTLASGGNDGTVRTWDTVRQTLINTLTGHTGSVRGVAFSPDGRTLASGGNDATVRTWDTASGTLTATLTGHTDAVWAVGFSPDGRTLASSGSDGTIRLWDSDPQDRALGICRVVGPVSPSRWARLLPEQPYRQICGPR